jgi:pimeloyl-ACP methyl ester carboxylesterase
MPDIERPDGAVIHYETVGSGYPLLLFAPGAVNSEIGFWEHGAINPMQSFADDFMVIGMDQRHAGASYTAPLTFSYDDVVADQLAVLDDLGIERAHVWGGCIGVAYITRIIHDAPQRISAGVGQDPVGLNETNSLDVFMAMFQPTIDLARSEGTAAVVQRALVNPIFILNNEAGPYGHRLKADADFRAEIEALSAEQYVAHVEAFASGMWPDAPPYFTVSEEWMATCDTPLMILPGSDHFHPTGIAERICRETKQATCLDVDCRSDAKLSDTIETVRAFLKQHTPA